MKKIRIGIVGAGGMTAYHIPGFRKAGAVVSAIADTNPAAASACAKKWGVGRVYPSLSAMLAGEELDAVSVITPNRFHAPLAIEALKAGKHVFCEKPPAMNARETLAMAKAAEKAGRRLLFNFCNRARPECEALKKEIDSGRFGKVNSVDAMWMRRTGIPGFGGWFTTKSLSGGGPLIDLLHSLDLALWFMGYPEPAHVLARTFGDFIRDRRFRGPWGILVREDGTCDVEAAARAFVTFKDGSCLAIRRVFGRDGDDSTAVDTCELYTMTARGARKDRPLTARRDEAMGRIRSAVNFVRTLQGREDPLSDPQEAVKLMKIVDAIYASSRTGRPVAL